jgi:hypothetical protein
MSNLLIVVSSKSPNNSLINCIYQLRQFYTSKICIIDSDSNDLHNYQTLLKLPLLDISVHLVKNKNYEYGGFKQAYELYPNYDKYMCIQDSLIISKFINIDIVDDTNALIFYHISGFHNHKATKEYARNILKNTSIKYDDEILETHFILAQHNSFIITNNIMRDIVKTFTIMPSSKKESCAYERLFGLYFIFRNIKTYNLQNFFQKIHGSIQYKRT